MADPSSANPPGAGVSCAQCQAALPADATFCLRCGARVQKPAAPAFHARSGTLLGVAMSPGAVPPPAAPPTAPAAPAFTQRADTVPDGSAAGAQPRRVASAHATMMGVAGPAGNAPAPQPAAPAPMPSGTIHGVTPAAVAQPSAPAARSGQTMQGVASAGPQGVPQGVSSTGRHRRDVMLGDQGPQAAPAAQPAPYTGGTYDDLAAVVPRRGPSLGWVLLGLFVVASASAGAWWYTHRPQPQAPLTATLRTQPGGEQIVSLAVPDAGSGARVRYEGREYPLDAQGRAEFPVTLPAGRVGYVDVPVEVVRGGGAVERRSLRFLVAWRAETDLRKLGEDPPKVHIVFHVMRGSSLSIAGQAIRVSGETGIAELAAPAPSPPGEGDARRERYPVRVVTPDGTAIEEQYELRVPRTQLRVQEPPPVLMTRDATVVVRGSAPHASRVRIGAQAATLSGGTFSAVVPVNAGSNSLDVVAYAPDGAPALVNLTVYRDVTPEAYLSTGGGDRGAAALAARPAVDGARLRVTGTVVGQVQTVDSGRTCQLVVESRACPGGRCTAWVNLPPGANVNPGAQVEVVGELRGSRSYATQTGERRTDPVVQAVIVTARRS